MPATTAQIAKIAGVSVQTVRNYTREYGELLSPQARGEAGARVFNDEDTRIFCAIVDLRKSGVPAAEVAQRIRRGDVVIDGYATLTTSVAPHQAPQTATEAPQVPTKVEYSPQAFIEALERHHARQTERLYWSHVRAFVAGMVTMAAAFYIAWLLVNGPPW